MVLHELEAKRRDSIATLQNVDKNENVTQFLNRKLRVGENEVCNNKVDEISEQQDGGWGWFVTFGAFVINLIVDGIVYTFGLFFIELYEYFDESKSLTAWVGSVAVGMLLLSGMPEIQLTHICLVDPSILIKWTSPFPILGESSVNFHFYSTLNKYSC